MIGLMGIPPLEIEMHLKDTISPISTFSPTGSFKGAANVLELGLQTKLINIDCQKKSTDYRLVWRFGLVISVKHTIYK